MSENVEQPIDDFGINCEDYESESECDEPCIWDELGCTYSYQDIILPNVYNFEPNSNVPSERRRKRIINPNIPRTHFPATKSVRKNFKTPSDPYIKPAFK